MVQKRVNGLGEGGEFAVAPGVAPGDILGLLQGHLQTLRRVPVHANRRLDHYDLLVALLLAVYEPTVRSLRTLDDASVSQTLMQRHLDAKRLAKSTLSEALASLDAKVVEPLVKRLMAQVPNLPRRDGDLAGLGRILAVDGSFFRVPAEVLWAIHHVNVNGQPSKKVRLNLQLDVLQFVPVGVSISGQDGTSEGAAIVAQGIIPEAVYLADRGYVDIDFIRAVLEAQADLVVRLRHNTCFEPTSSRPLDPEDQQAHVLSDTVGIMPRVGPQPLRIVEVYDTRNQKTVRLLTSLLEVPAPIIAKLYRYRWMIELFFRWLKCVARVKHLMSHSANGITLQFYAAVIAVLAGYLVTGVKPGLYEYNMLCGALRGTVTTEGMLQVFARRARERELERIRRAKKQQA